MLCFILELAVPMNITPYDVASLCFLSSHRLCIVILYKKTFQTPFMLIVDRAHTLWSIHYGTSAVAIKWFFLCSPEMFGRWIIFCTMCISFTTFYAVKFFSESSICMFIAAQLCCNLCCVHDYCNHYQLHGCGTLPRSSTIAVHVVGRGTVGHAQLVEYVRPSFFMLASHKH